MTAPDHNETIDLAANIGSSYKVGGYAYTGGGCCIAGVEITTGIGMHWEVWYARSIRFKCPPCTGVGYGGITTCAFLTS